MQTNLIFSVSLSFYLFTIVINLCHHKFVTADVIAVFATNNVVFGEEDKVFIKSMYLKRYTQQRG